MSKENAINPLEQALAEILTKSMQGIEKGVDFLSAQLPDVIEQLLLWKMWESIIGNLTLWIFAFFVPLILLLSNVSKALSTLSEERFDKHVLFSLISGIWILFGSLVLTKNSDLEWLQILIAPKIYLIEYAAQLIK
jgi:hypothetical protein